MEGARWAVVATYAGGLEADMAVELLKSEGILAVRRDNDTTGIFGPGFQGPSARGAAVLAPSSAVEEAWEILGVTPTEQQARELAQLGDPSSEGADGSGDARPRAKAATWILLMIAALVAAIVIGYAAGH